MTRKGIVLLGMALSVLCSYAGVKDMEQVKRKMLSLNTIIESVPTTEFREAQPQLDKTVSLVQVKQYIDTQLPDGSWADINYQDQNRSAWMPEHHARRLLEMAIVYKDKKSPFHRDKELSSQIHKGMKFWDDGDFVCPNWWYNEIGTPRVMGLLYLLMEDEMSATEMTNAVKYMENAKIGLTGQNSAWLAENVLMRALLQKDERLFSQAHGYIVKEMAISPDGEGVRPDMSFHQHGAQQQFGNYGLSFALSASYWARVFKGTKYAPSKEQMAVLRGYLLEGMQWIYWKGYLDISSCGRQVTPNTQKKKAYAYGLALQNMIDADPEYAGEYKKTYDRDAVAVSSGNCFTGNRYFYCSDYGVHRTEKWFSGLKMSSNRTIGAEIINTENLLGMYTGNGAVCYYNRGNEYENIFPVWDWAMLPGTTCFKTDSLFPGVIQYKYYNNQHDFVGGISDNNTGIAAMELTDQGLTARKSYFFTDEAVVCMGSGIRGDKDFEIVTTIEQKLRNGEIVSHPVASPLKGEAIYHDEMVYYSFISPSVQLKTGTASGNWQRTAAYLDTTTVEKDVFKLWINHGALPDGGSYGYMVFPASGKENMQESILQSGIEPLCLNEKAHIIRQGNMIQAAFFEPFSFKISDGKELFVNQPCLIILKSDAGKQKLSICDPTQKEPEITVRVSGKWEGEYCQYNEKDKQTIIAVSTGDLKGEAICFYLQKSETKLNIQQ